MSKPIHVGIKNEAAAGTLELHFTDMIYDGFNWDTWERENMVQDTIEKIRAANPSSIKVVINSLGGDVMIGLALYNYLKAHPASVSVEVIGFAASIASIIAMCADPGKLKMAKNAFMIIHAAWSTAAGNAKEIREQAETLDLVTNQLADIYAQRSGKTAQHFTDLWANGDYWITGTEALALGLADELFNAEVPVNAHIKEFGFHNIPEHLLPKDAAGGSTPEDPKGFFKSLKNEFMSLLQDFKASINSAKTDPINASIAGREEILAMVEKVMEPVIARFDAAFPEEDAKADDKKADDVKADDKKVEDKKDEAPVKTAAEIKMEQMERDMQALKDSIAGKNTKPEGESVSRADKLAASFQVQYEAEN